MNYKFKEDQTEAYYRKLLLLDKVKPFLNKMQKQYIFDLGYCWDILFKDKKAPFYCYWYAKYVLKGEFEEGESFIAKDSGCSAMYAMQIISKEFPLGEHSIKLNHYWKHRYIKFLDTL